MLSACPEGGLDRDGLSVKNVFKGTVTKVHDGDSIHITPAGKKRVIIRLAAIDAPEVKQRYGIASRDHLRTMILNKQVAAYCNKVDKYQRQVCVVKKDGLDINLEMLKAGKAWYYERFKNEQSSSNQRSYRKSARTAEIKKLGLWSDPTSIPPWDFRSKAQN